MAFIVFSACFESRGKFCFFEDGGWGVAGCNPALGVAAYWCGAISPLCGAQWLNTRSRAGYRSFARYAAPIDA